MTFRLLRPALIPLSRFLSKALVIPSLIGHRNGFGRSKHCLNLQTWPSIWHDQAQPGLVSLSRRLRHEQTQPGIELLSRLLPRRHIVHCNVGHWLETSSMGSAEDGAIFHKTDFLRDLDSGGAAGSGDLILIVLNYKLCHLTPAIWNRASVRVCADGGANRLYDVLPLLLPGRTASDVRASHVPDVIVGDLDSLRADVREYYAKRGTGVVDQSWDQDSTDLQKCLQYVQDHYPTTRQAKVVVVGGLGGRMDHQMSNMHTLHLFHRRRIVLLGVHNLMTLLPADVRNHIIPDLASEGPTCGLVPVAGPALDTTTTGLQWNLSGQTLAMGQLVSTSNFIVAPTVEVQSKAPLLWMTELKTPPDDDDQGEENSEAIQ